MSSITPRLARTCRSTVVAAAACSLLFVSACGMLDYREAGSASETTSTTSTTLVEISVPPPPTVPPVALTVPPPTAPAQVPLPLPTDPAAGRELPADLGFPVGDPRLSPACAALAEVRSIGYQYFVVERTQDDVGLLRNSIRGTLEASRTWLQFLAGGDRDIVATQLERAAVMDQQLDEFVDFRSLADATGPTMGSLVLAVEPVVDRELVGCPILDPLVPDLVQE